MYLIFKMTVDYLYLMAFFISMLTGCNTGRIISRRVVHTVGPSHSRTVSSSHNGNQIVSHSKISNGMIMPHSSQTQHGKPHAPHGQVQHRHTHFNHRQPNHGNIHHKSSSQIHHSKEAKDMLTNMAPGTVVLTSRRINLANPGNPVSHTRVVLQPGSQHIPSSHGDKSESNSIHAVQHRQQTVPNSFHKSWWSKTIQLQPNGHVSESNKPPQTMNGRVWTKTMPLFTSNSSIINITSSSSSHDQIIKDFLSRLPPGASGRISISGGGVPQQVVHSVHHGHSGISHGHLSGHAHLPSHSISRTVYSHSSTNGKSSHQTDNKHRYLPQPKQSITASVGSNGKILNEGDKYLLLEDHNRVRRSANPPASNMKKLIWDVELEKTAQSYAKLCKWKHDRKRHKKSESYGLVGQNMHARRGSRDVLGATKNWEAEKANYNIYTRVCTPGQICGHYTQMVWAETETVGCAMWMCPYIHNLGWRNAYLIVCNYGPGGNIDGVMPYKIGQTCSNCDTGHPSCSQGLCV